MMWNGWKGLTGGRGIRSLGASLAVGLGMTACSRDYTVAYVYVTAITKGTTGMVNSYAVDYQTGALTPLAESPSTGTNPVALVASPDQKNIYVIDNGAPSSDVQHFTIGTDGKLYPAANATPVVGNADNSIVGSFPTALAIDPAGKFLYVTFKYQNGYTNLNPGPGGIAVFPISSDGSLGAPVMDGNLPYFPIGNNPSGIVVSPRTGPNGNFVYVIDQEPTSGVLLSFSQNSNGSLTAIPGSVFGGVAVGTTPAAIAEDPGSHFLYVSDQATNQLYGYIVQAGGAPQAMATSPFATGSFPLGVTVDPRGEYVYVANFGSSTISAYAIKQSSGSLSGISGSTSGTVATGPTCVAIEPALGVYLYTSNKIDNSVSAEKLLPETGALSQVLGSQFNASALPSCVVSVSNGSHATQIID